MPLATIISDTISVIERLKFLRQKIKHENSQLRLRNINEVENGDVIKVNRGLYDHYGIFVKDNQHVIHYTGENDSNDFNGIVRETSLLEFLNGANDFIVCRFPEKIEQLTFLDNRNLLSNLWQKIKELKLKIYHLYSGDETVRRARNELGKRKYNLLCNNCEHFAIWCKTGLRESSQVNKIIETLITLCSKRI